MASFATQLKDMFFVLVERVKGYGRADDQHPAAGTQDPIKLEASRTEEVVVVKHTEIRARSAAIFEKKSAKSSDDEPNVPRGSLPQVNKAIL